MDPGGSKMAPRSPQEALRWHQDRSSAVAETHTKIVKKTYILF